MFKEYVEFLAKAWRTSDDLATILEDVVVIDLKRYFFHFVKKAML